MPQAASTKRAPVLSRLSRSLGFTLPFLMIGLTVMGSIAVGVAAFGFARSGLEEAGRMQVSILADSRAEAFNQAMKRSVDDLDALASSQATQLAISDLSTMIDTSPGDIATVQAFFAGGATLEDRVANLGADTVTSYSFRHTRFHGGAVATWRNNGYGDIYLINAQGYVVYSVTKSADFFLNLKDKKVAPGNPLAAIMGAAEAADPGVTVVSDYAPYAANDGKPGLFMARAIRDMETAKHKLVGFVVFRLDSTFFNGILDGRQGHGTTGQTFLIDDAGTVLSDMPLVGTPTALALTIDNPALVAAPGGDAEIETTRINEAGIANLSAAVPVQFFDKRWAVVAERAESEVMAAVGAIFQAMLIATLLVIGLASAIGIFFARGISGPIDRLNRSMRQLAEGDLAVAIGFARRRDEIGEMARTVEVFRDNAMKVREMTEAEVAASGRRREERAEMMQDLQRAFGEVVDAAIAGDFSQRVGAEFPDAELNALARSVNDLVETVDRGLGETGQVLEALAETDLTRRVMGSYQGSFARLKQSTNAVADKLTGIVTQLRETSRGLKTATGEILSGANDLSERTTKQAATIEETSAAMEQLAHTVMENAKRAGAASDQARKASHTAEDGGEVMAEANQAMERISASSSKISNIIGMIDDIAFQTNLLALNASVEAARAGEAGKGFAVVAIEVRRLAQSAAEASSEVKVLIEKSGEEVSGGTRLVASAAEKLSAILEAVKANAGQMEAIAHDSREQASAIEEVNTAVRQMDEMTQHNAALVEQTNAAIEQTEAQASELDRIVEVFTLADAGAPSRDQPAPARAASRPAATAPRDRQDRAAPAARKSYLARGNAALDKDWSEF